MPEESVLNIAVGGLTGLFSIVIIFIIAIVMVGGNLYPMIRELGPTANSSGISAAQYNESTNDIWFGLKTIFYILIVSVFAFVAVKLLYQKQESSYYG